MTHKEALLIDAIDMEILMHRDSHFGSNFAIMLEYYEQGGVGMMPDFEIEEIKKLKKLEEEEEQNLSLLYLPEAAQKIVSDSKQIYQKLRDVYSEDPADPLAILVSDLILSEEATPKQEIAALTSKGKEVISLLIHLLSSPSFYDPLFPGYGRSPIFVARCLALIQDERAIPPLFEALGQDNFFTDEEIIKALCSFGERAKSFLLSILRQKPLSKDNEYAAIVLNAFPEDEEISGACLNLLEEEEVRKRGSLATYLVFACSHLIEAKEREKFTRISNEKGISKDLLDEMALVIKNWK